MATDQTSRNEQANAGISAEDHQKYVEIFNALIDKGSARRNSIQRIYRDGKLVSIRSGWHWGHEEVDSQEFVDQAFAAIAEDRALQAQKNSPADNQPPSAAVIDRQANTKTDLVSEEGK